MKTHGTEKEFRSCTLVMKVYRNASTCETKSSKSMFSRTVIHMQQPASCAHASDASESMSCLVTTAQMQSEALPPHVMVA